MAQPQIPNESVNGDHASKHETYRDRGDGFRPKAHKACHSSSGMLNGSTCEKPRKLYRVLRRHIINTSKTTDFIPFDKVELARNCELVEQALGEDGVPQSDIPRLSNKICHPDPQGVIFFFRIFAILVLCENVKCIREFIDRGVDDSYLPFPKVERDDDQVIKITRKRGGRQISIGVLSDLFRDHGHWRQPTLDSFDRYQWWIIAPYFDRPPKIIPHYILEPEDVLPITEKKGHLQLEVESLDPDVKQVILQGGYGDVFIVKIHPSHHNFSKEPYIKGSNSFALKRLKSRNTVEFQLEVDALRKYNYGIDKHLIPLLATIEKENDAGKYYLLFPKANGDLRYLWKTEFSEQQDRVLTARWMAEQCLGIANALSILHRDQDLDEGDHPIYGRHGDIKAGNILWFSKPDIQGPNGWCLVLSDFGLMKFHRIHSISAQTAGRLKKTLTYQAPEFDIVKAKVSRKSDIWALGCTYLEFITCYISGSKAVEEEFPTQRGEEDKNLPGVNEDKFYRTIANEPGAELKPGVRGWIAELRSNPKCSQYLQDFLDLIVEGMLSIRLAERLSASELVQDLQILLGRCQDEAYLSERSAS